MKKERTAEKLSVFALLHPLLVGLNHFLERVTRTKSEIFQRFVYHFPGGELDLQVQGVVIFRGSEDFVDVLIDEFLVDDTVLRVPLGIP